MGGYDRGLCLPPLESTRNGALRSRSDGRTDPGEEGGEADVGTAKCNLATCRRNCPRPVLHLDARN
jgi:hypothetical protein